MREFRFTLFPCLVLGVTLLAQTARALPLKLDLSNTPNIDRGGRSGDDQYTAPNGTIVTANTKTWTNGNYYYMEYLFNESYGGSGAHDQYWLTDVGTQVGPGPMTLTFAFDQAYGIDFVRVYARGVPVIESADRASDYRLYLSDDGVSWDEITPGLVVTDTDAVGDFHDHAAGRNASFAKFELSLAASLGSALAEVEFYLPEPTAASVLLLGLPALLRRRAARAPASKM